MQPEIKRFDHVTERLVPARNPDPHDRAQAWNEWIAARGADPVLRFIRWSNGTTTEDEEILQDTLITAYLKVERGDYEFREVPFTAFLKQIARYKILEAARKHRRQVAFDDLTDLADDDQQVTERVEFWREYDEMHNALGQISPRRSKVLILYETGYSTSEIADQLGISEDLVRKEKSLGLRQLREKVELAVAN